MCSRMVRRISIVFLWLAIHTVCPDTINAALLRVGPAEDPEQWPDWGGTPDLTLPEEMGLSVSELNAYLEKLGSADAGVRARAVEELIRDAAGSEAMFRKTLFEGHGARNDEMRAAVREARKRASQNTSKEGLLKGLLSIDPADDAVGNGARAALRILAMLYALNTLDTLAAYKVMMDFSPKYAGGFRHEIGRLIISHGMNAMPALVYGRGSKDKNIHMFSVKWIRDMGNPLLSEQVKIKNPRRLAQLLEAYASVNELDAIDVTLSMTNHQSSFVRAAARSALAQYGRNAFWPARRKYENTFGEEPAENMDVEVILTALYTRFDNQRLARSRELFARGLEAHRAGRLKEMATIYKEVLKAEPLFPRRDEMAKGFFELALHLDEHAEPDRKKEALMMARRVSAPDTEVARRTAAELMWLEAEALRREGVAPLALYQRILSLVPAHPGAGEMVKMLSPGTVDRQELILRAIMVSFVIFLAVTLLFLRLRRLSRS
jgi:hypothetical protein